jgi:hypothetical protein
VTGCETREELQEGLLGRLTLRDLIEKIVCPVLFVHATGDQFIPTSQVWMMYEKVGGPKEMLLNEGGDHCSVAFGNVVWPKKFDWLADRLGAAPGPVMEQLVEGVGSSVEPAQPAEIAQRPAGVGPSVEAAHPAEVDEEKTGEAAALVFTPEAEELFSQVPFFLKRRARKAIEEAALERGVTEITPELILEVRKKVLGF